MKNSGCNGGLMDYAFEYAEKTSLEKESDYPYTSRHGSRGSCKYQSSKGVVKVKSFTDVRNDS
jgi:hypothetical protein